MWLRSHLLLYNGSKLTEEVDNAGNVLARYTHSSNVDEPLSELRSGTTSYYQADGLGSSTSRSNSSAGLSNTYSYDSFGRLVGSTGTLANPFQYTSREFDSETGPVLLPRQILQPVHRPLHQ